MFWKKILLSVFYSNTIDILIEENSVIYVREYFYRALFSNNPNLHMSWFLCSTYNMKIFFHWFFVKFKRRLQAYVQINQILANNWFVRIRIDCFVVVSKRKSTKALKCIFQVRENCCSVRGTIWLLIAFIFFLFYRFTTSLLLPSRIFFFLILSGNAHCESFGFFQHVKTPKMWIITILLR